MARRKEDRVTTGSPELSAPAEIAAPSWVSCASPSRRIPHMHTCTAHLETRTRMYEARARTAIKAASRYTGLSKFGLEKTRRRTRWSGGTRNKRGRLYQLTKRHVL